MSEANSINVAETADVTKTVASVAYGIAAGAALAGVTLTPTGAFDRAALENASANWLKVQVTPNAGVVLNANPFVIVRPNTTYSFDLGSKSGSNVSGAVPAAINVIVTAIAAPAAGTNVPTTAAVPAAVAAALVTAGQLILNVSAN